MIKEVEFGNYKAFKEGALKIKPITILLGSNSAGKSSLIQLLLMLTQTYASSKNLQNCLQLNGDLVKHGELKNIFYNKKTNLNINLKFKVNFNYNFYKPLINVIEDDIENLHYVLDRVDKSIATRKPIKNKFSLYNKDLNLTTFVEEKGADYFLKNFTRLKRSINKSLKFLSEEEFTKVMRSRSNYRFHLSRFTNVNLFSSKEKRLNIDFAPLKHAYQCAQELVYFDHNNLYVSYQIGFINKRKNIQIKQFKIFSHDSRILEYRYNSSRGGKFHILESDIFNEKILEKYASKFGNSIDLSNIQLFDGLTRRRRRVGKNFFIEFLLDIVRVSTNPINETFNYRNINYINPLRAYPRRYYFQDEIISAISTQSLDTIHLIDLFRERPYIKRKVNAWMKKFNVNIDIDQLEEVVHKIKVNHTGLNLDLTDVGFGISQVMPIIAQCYLANKDSLTLIEQPEIHLHPKMQADLADLFIDSCLEEDNNKNFIIETHSEYLLKRLRRRISEGKISRDDIALYFVHSKNNKDDFAKIKEIEVENSGNFEWPVGFYEVDLEDTMEFLKNQS